MQPGKAAVGGGLGKPVKAWEEDDPKVQERLDREERILAEINRERDRLEIVEKKREEYRKKAAKLNK